MITVKGTIKDEKGEALSYANVIITDKTGTPKQVNGQVVGRTADDSGAFLIPVAMPEDSFLKFSYVGKQTEIIKATEAAKKKTIVLGNNSAIPEVVITAKKLPKMTKKTNWLLWIGGGLAVVVIIAGIIYMIKK